MRVLHVSPYFAPAFTYGGPPRSVLGLCRALQRAGCDVHVVTTTADGSRQLDPGVDASYEGVPVSYLPLGAPRRYFRGRGAASFIRKRLNTADLVHVHGCWNFMGWAAAHACLQSERPYLSTPRGMLSSWSLAHGSWLKTLAYWSIERRVQRRAAVHHATSEAEREEILRLGFGRPIVTIPNGIDVPPPPAPGVRQAFRTRFGIPHNAPVVLSLGRLHPKKGLDLLGEAMRHVQSTIPAATLVLVGEGAGGYRQELEGHLRPMLGERVVFTGQLDGADRDAAYAAADVFALASQSENFALVVGEAMAAGLPVVVTRGCPWPQIEQWQAGFWVERQPEAVADALATLLGDARLRCETGVHGRAAVSRAFGWNEIARGMIAVYETCLNGHPVAF